MTTGRGQSDRYCSIEFTARDLDPDVITIHLGRQPDSSFRRGDLFNGGYSRVQGAWVASSEDQVISDDVNDHLTWATNFMTEHKEDILRTKQDCDCAVRLRIFWQFDATMSFVFTCEMLGLFSTLLDDVSLSVV